MSAPESKDPERLDVAADPMLRALLRAGREDVPNDAQLAVLAAKLGPIVGGGGGGAGGGAGGAAIKATAVKTMAGATLAKIVGAVTTVAVVGVATARFVATPSTTRAPVAAVVATTSPTTTAIAAAPTAPASEPAIPSAPSATPSTTSPPAASPAPDPDAETKLLGRAQSDLNGDPARALGEANELARRFPHGELAQEREVIAIDALSRLGRRDEANARATRFAAAYPQSAYRRRIDAILER